MSHAHRIIALRNESDLIAGREQYAANSWLLISSFLCASDASEYCREVVKSGETRRVTVGKSKQSWAEYGVPRASALAQLLTSRQLIAVLSYLTDSILNRRKTQLWSHAYGHGEYIPWHKDRDGTTQLLLSLQHPTHIKGGAFQMRFGRRECCILLHPGDALLFRATDISHSTTAVLNKGLCSLNDQRIVAVARYFCTETAMLEPSL